MLHKIFVVLSFVQIYQAKICWKECGNENVVQVSKSNITMSLLGPGLQLWVLCCLERRYRRMQAKVNLSSHSRFPLWGHPGSTLHSPERGHCLPSRGLGQPGDRQHDAVHSLGLLDRAAMGRNGNWSLSLSGWRKRLSEECPGKIFALKYFPCHR